MRIYTYLTSSCSAMMLAGVISILFLTAGDINAQSTTPDWFYTSLKRSPERVNLCVTGAHPDLRQEAYEMALADGVKSVLSQWNELAAQTEQPRLPWDALPILTKQVQVQRSEFISSDGSEMVYLEISLHPGVFRFAEILLGGGRGVVSESRLHLVHTIPASWQLTTPASRTGPESTRPPQSGTSTTRTNPTTERTATPSRTTTQARAQSTTPSRTSRTAPPTQQNSRITRTLPVTAANTMEIAAWTSNNESSEFQSSGSSEALHGWRLSAAGGSGSGAQGFRIEHDYLFPLASVGMQGSIRWIRAGILLGQNLKNGGYSAIFISMSRWTLPGGSIWDEYTLNSRALQFGYLLNTASNHQTEKIERIEIDLAVYPNYRSSVEIAVRLGPFIPGYRFEGYLLPLSPPQWKPEYIYSQPGDRDAGALRVA